MFKKWIRFLGDPRRDTFRICPDLFCVLTALREVRIFQTEIRLLVVTAIIATVVSAIATVIAAVA